MGAGVYILSESGSENWSKSRFLRGFGAGKNRIVVELAVLKLVCGKSVKKVRNVRNPREKGVKNSENRHFWTNFNSESIA